MITLLQCNHCILKVCQYNGTLFRLSVLFVRLTEKEKYSLLLGNFG